MENWLYILIRSGDSKTVNFTVKGLKNKKVKFSGGGNIISISNNTLKAKKSKSILKNGDEYVVVTATIYDGSKYVCDYSITCFIGGTKNKFVPVTNIIVYSNYNSKKRIGNSFSFNGDTKIVAEIVPKEATNHNIKVSSSNTNVLQVTSISGGEIGLHAVGSGTVKLTIQAGFTNGNGTKADIINKEIYVNVHPILVKDIKVYSDYDRKIEAQKSFSIEKNTTLVAEIFPKNATNHTINVKSSNSSIVSVSKSKQGGEIYLKPNKIGGPVKISITSGNVNKTYSVTVSNLVKDIKVYKIDNNKKIKAPSSFEIKKETTLEIELEPKNASYQAIEVEASNSRVSVSKSKDGRKIYLTPKSVGLPTNITIKSNSRNVIKNYTVKVSKDATLSVNVDLTPKEPNKAASPTKPQVKTTKKVTKVTLDRTSLSIKKGKSYDRLKATVSPSDASEKRVVWSTSNKSVATVTDYGKVIAHNYGNAKIYATAKDGSKKYGACNVSVWAPVTWIKMSSTNITLKNGKSKTISATAYPTYAKYRDISWSSSNPSVASVDSKGKITANKKGSATIRAKTKDGYSKTCKVTVTQPVEYITISKSGISISKGKSYKLTAKVHPSNANCQSIKWESSKNYYATVKKGKVKGKHVGNARIRAYVEDSINGNKVHSAYCSVAIKPVKVSSVSITSSMHINKGSSKRISRTIKPSNASNSKLNWSSSNSSVASVSSSGWVTARKSGTVTITAKAKDGSGKKDTCHVVVDDPKKDLKQRRSGH